MKGEKYILLVTSAVAKRKESDWANYAKNILILVYGFVLALSLSVFSLNIVSSNSRFSKKRFFYSRSKSIYSRNIVLVYSVYSKSKVYLNSFRLSPSLICTSSHVHLSFSKYSEYSDRLVNQTDFIVIRLVNLIALHLGRPPPKTQVSNKKPPIAVGG